MVKNGFQDQNAPISPLTSLWPWSELSEVASTLAQFVISQRTFLAWMPSINKKCHQNVFLGIVQIMPSWLLGSFLGIIVVNHILISPRSHKVKLVSFGQKWITLKTSKSCRRTAPESRFANKAKMFLSAKNTRSQNHLTLTEYNGAKTLDHALTHYPEVWCSSIKKSSRCKANSLDHEI